MAVLRVLQDDALDGPCNMARDEALLERVGRGQSPPTLRLYQWIEPTISLGYFQHFADYERLEPPLAGLPVVRRPTGGGAILHDLELTYCLVVDANHELLSHGPNRLYEQMHRAMIEALAMLGADAAWSNVTDDSTPSRGPFFCFARRHRYDLLTDNHKIAGSAQRRTRRGLLQHGSIILASRFAQHSPIRLNVPFDQAVQRMRRDLALNAADTMGVNLEPGDWTADEVAEARLLIPKYAGWEWTRRM